MKKIFLTLFLCASLNVFSQKSKTKINVINIESLQFEVDSVDELETIDWKDVKETFEENSPESSIFLKITVANKKKGKLKKSFSYKVDGKAKDIDSLITRIKKGIKLFKKIN